LLFIIGAAPAALIALTASPAHAAAGLEGASLGAAWALPFVGILLSIAILPQLSHRFWDRHMGALSTFWALLVLVPLALAFGSGTAFDAALDVLLTEYLPFILLLFALYTIAGGLVIGGNLRGSPGLNTAIIAFGTLLASFIGTTGASMILIRPIIRANDGRPHNVHIVVFFIFLVSNIGGALSPLGDPPLFLGFLRGVDFFWTTRALLPQTLFMAGCLLGLFYGLDRYLFAREGGGRDPTPSDRKLRVRGNVNILLIGALLGAVLLSGLWRPGVSFTVRSTTVELQNVVRDATVVALALLSLMLTSRRNRAANDFSWRPIVEVATIFAGIFICIVPVAAALAAGQDGAFAPLLGLVSRADGSPNEIAYFWLTGLLSSVLDNAPTYLVSFELAGGDPARLMGPLAGTLAAISMGAVFMGANTYIGNAPNFMVYAIARQAGIRMPGFLGYMAWSGTILLPLFVLVTILFIR